MTKKVDKGTNQINNKGKDKGGRDAQITARDSIKLKHLLSNIRKSLSFFFQKSSPFLTEEI